MQLRKTAIAACLALLAARPAVAATAAGPPSQTLQACARAVNAGHSPGSRDQALSRGVNITTLFDQAPVARDLADIPKLRKIGVRHIRIPIDPVWVLSWPASGAADEKLRRLDIAVCDALSSGLAVILDNHDGSLQPKDTSG